MNIFVTSYCPAQSARWLDDKRVNKMIVETAQMLSGVIRSCVVPHYLNNHPFERHLYQATHMRHPCSIWAGQSYDNAKWLLDHGLALSDIYTRKTGKEHASRTTLTAVFVLLDRADFEHHAKTPFANCARNTEKGIDFSHVWDTVEAYKLYLALRWASDVRTPTWHHGEPEWRAEYERLGKSITASPVFPKESAVPQGAEG